MKSKEKVLVVMDKQRLTKTLHDFTDKISEQVNDFVNEIFDPMQDVFQVDYVGNGNPRFLPAERENHRNRIEQKKNHRRLSRRCKDCDHPFFVDEEDFYQIEMHGRCVKCKKNQDELDEKERIRKLDERWETMRGFFSESKPTKEKEG